MGKLGVMGQVETAFPVTYNKLDLYNFCQTKMGKAELHSIIGQEFIILKAFLRYYRIILIVYCRGVCRNRGKRSFLKGMSTVDLRIYDNKAFEVDTSAQFILNYLNRMFKDRKDCICYYRNPLYYTEGNFIPSFVLLDRIFGVVIIKTYNFSKDNVSMIGENYWDINGNKTPNELALLLDYSYELTNDINRPANKLSGKVKVISYICFPFLQYDDKIVARDLEKDNILFEDFESKKIFNLSGNELSDNEWRLLDSIIQKANALNKTTGIKIGEPIGNLRDAIIFNEQQIYLFDDEQLAAGLHITDSPERIRGLAGTGKTIILAMKAARIHYLHPEDKILYTFYTQSLYNQVKNLIAKFYRKIRGDEPNWDNLQVKHAWGSKAKSGVYRSTCLSHGLIPKSLNDVKYCKNPFAEICGQLLSQQLIPEYDCVLIDEAQDMPLEFFRLVEKITKTPKRIVWAYDELQSTGDVKIPDSEELFGKDENGEPKILLSKERDFILRKSYRNHRQVLFLAVALGFGIYSKHGFAQMIGQKETWQALGFEVKGNLVPGEEVEIERPLINSPNKIRDYYNKYDILNIYSAQKRADEIVFVSDKIVALVTKENVNPHDILVIDLGTDPSETLKAVQGNLFENRINSVLPGLVDGADDFFISGCVTLTTVRRAKGNEAPIIFVMGIDNIYSFKNKLHARVLRNMAFISITRSKGWCFITGSGNRMKEFNEECKLITANFPFYKFKYPTEEQLREIENINYLTKDSAAEKRYQEQVDMLDELLKGDPELTKLFLSKTTKGKLKDFLRRLE